MKGIPSELFYALIFVGVILYQFMMRRRAAMTEQARQDEQQLRQQEVEPQGTVDNFLDFGRLEQPAPAAATPPPVTVRSLIPVLANVASAASARRPRRRFSRQALLGNRRDVQNAVVIATILGPCRGMDPPGGAGAPDLTSPSAR